MVYAEQDFKRDLFFIIGFFRGSLAETPIDEENFEQFRKYCFKHFSKQGLI